MADMFDNLRAGRGIRGNPRHDKDNEPKRWWVPGAHNTNCSQCGRERASGSAKFSDGTWKKIGPSCRKAMGIKPSDKRDQSGHTGTGNNQPNKPYKTKANREPIKVKSKRTDGK